MYSNIVFDVDGTLIDTEDASLLSLRDLVLEVLKIDMPLEDLLFSQGIPSREALDILGIELSEKTGILWQGYYSKYITNDLLFEGIAETLEQLRIIECPLGIITSRSNSEYQKDFAPLGLSHYFQYVICANDTKKHKPDPEPMLKYLELSGADPSKVLYIGDTQYDMECATGAGVDFALALWGAKNPDSIKAKYHLKHPGEVLGFCTSQR